jgi:hypothetical protein
MEGPAAQLHCPAGGAAAGGLLSPFLPPALPTASYARTATQSIRSSVQLGSAAAEAAAAAASASSLREEQHLVAAAGAAARSGTYSSIPAASSLREEQQAAASAHGRSSSSSIAQELAFAGASGGLAGLFPLLLWGLIHQPSPDIRLPPRTPSPNSRLAGAAAA